MSHIVTKPSTTAGTGGTQTFTTGVAYAYRQTAVSTNVTGADGIVGCTAGGITATLPLLTAVPRGFRVTVKDESGTAGSSNITVSGNGSNIDGSSTKVINTNYGSYDLYAGASAWGII